MAGRIHNDVTDDLGSRIVAGEIAPDAVFTLAQLEHDYNASRTVARDAVQVLESLGLVASRRRVGITVQPRDSWDALAPRVIGWNLHGPFRQQQLEALMELRVAVEPTAARLAAARASAAQRAELRRLASRLRTLAVEGGGASDDFLAADVRFHDLLLHASGNPQLIALRAPVREVLTGRTRLGLTPQMPAPERSRSTNPSPPRSARETARRRRRTPARTCWRSGARSRPTTRSRDRRQCGAP